MARMHNSNRNGGAWTEDEKRAVWQKGREMINFPTKDGNKADFPPKDWRMDICGNPMKYTEHGNRNSEYGWEIDHINPVSNGGGDEIGNLQPLYWNNNAAKGDKLNWRCGQ